MGKNTDFYTSGHRCIHLCKWHVQLFVFNVWHVEVGFHNIFANRYSVRSITLAKEFIDS